MNTNRKHAYCFFLNPLYGAHQTPLEVYEDESEVIKIFVSTCGSKAVKIEHTNLRDKTILTRTCLQVSDVTSG